jgi:hypothetical protein
MIGTCWSSSFMISLINSAFRPVNLCGPAARAFLDVIRVRVGTTTAETPTARVRKERRDGTGGAPAAPIGPLVALIGSSVFDLNPRILILPLRNHAVQGRHIRENDIATAATISVWRLLSSPPSHRDGHVGLIRSGKRLQAESLYRTGNHLVS